MEVDCKCKNIEKPVASCDKINHSGMRLTAAAVPIHEQIREWRNHERAVSQKASKAATRIAVSINSE